MSKTSLFTTFTSLLHIKCRDYVHPYLRSSVYRFEVPDDKVSWTNEFDEYEPTDYTDPSNYNKPWSDGNLNSFHRCWNSVDGNVDRRSHLGIYKLDTDGRPLNPMGRTGLKGRGVLGRWGPNHAADPLVTRFSDGHLQFVGIKRRDTGEWAIPGGMVDPGENISETLKREFAEEALHKVKTSDLQSLWQKGVELYRGYVDDPRNTDNSWMETVVVNFHDHDNVLKDVKLMAGSDAASVNWITVSRDTRLYASHEHFIHLLAKHHKLTL